jgi:hypothetical protein
LRRWLAVLLVLALVVPTGTTSARFGTQMDWTEGRFEAGLVGAGESLTPENAPSVDHERLAFTVSPCHRDLELDLEYEPSEAELLVAGNGLVLPYRFRVSLYDPAGERLTRYTVDEPDHGLYLPTVAEAETYTLQLELLEGVLVDWRARVQGWGVDDPTCGLWLNEVETNPSGDDEGAEWVEVYNEADEPIDLADWTIRVTGDNTDRSYPLPARAQAPAGGEHAAFDLDGDEPVPDANATVELVPPEGGALDASPTLDDPRDDGFTHQRSPDAARTWVFAEGTRGAANPDRG